MQVELINITPDAEKVIESAGRTAYLSFDKETAAPIIQAASGKETAIFRADDHPHLKGVGVGEVFDVEDREWRAVKVWTRSAEKFVEMLIRVGHYSVLEHASATFRIRGGSRAFTHQLVRHRMASFTQQSQRYVSEDAFRVVEPPSIREHSEAHALFVDTMERSRQAYLQLQSMGIRNEDARFVLPNAIESEIVVTADLREWRHIVELRGVAKAQWEIRRIVVDILRILKENVPAAFCDLEIDEGKAVVVKTFIKG